MKLTSESADKITIGQFMEEAAFFERSQEYMDLLKESYEVELMERYCECMDFMTENADSIGEEMKAELMTEARNADTTMSAVIEKKKDSIWKKIKNAVTKIITAIVKVFGRLAKFWKNGEEVEHLRREALLIKTDRDIAKKDLAAAESKIEAIIKSKKSVVGTLRGQIDDKNKEIATLKVLSAKKDAEIARVHAMFKGVNPGLYKELQEVESMIAEEIVVYMPVTVSEIDDFTQEVAEVIESYKVIRGKYAGNGDLHRKHAARIKRTLTKLRSSRNQMVKKTINGVWLEETYKSLSQDKDKIQSGMNDITASFNAAQDNVPNNMDSTKNKAVHAVRVSADDNYMELQRNLTGLLNEWILLANTTLTTMKELMEIRSHNLKMEAEILSEIKRIKKVSA